MRVMIAAGGTGGHIYPGIAVAKEAMRRNRESEVRFVGTARGLETRLVPQAGFELSLIESAGLKNVGMLARVRGMLLLPKSFVAARTLIKEFRPDIVIGAGGYVSGPVLLTASLLKVPTLAMESNALPGWTNRVLARFVTRAAVSFEAALPYFRGKAVVTGNPVRREFFDIPAKSRDASRFSVLVFGGSQGARAINDAIIAALPHLAAHKKVLHFTHQTGEADFEKIQQGYANDGWTENADVRRYIDDMMAEFAASDLIVSRAGATTSAELIAAGKAAIMVPFPLAADDHQRKNAEALEAAGAARMILQSDLTGERLAGEIAKLIAAPDEITSMEQAARKLARGDAAKATVDLMEELVKRDCLALMKNYKVSVYGENFLMNLEGVKQKLRFYTTRFVKASSEEEAEYAVMDLLRTELASDVLNQESDSPMMYMEEIEELKSFDGYPYPGTGFTFFPSEDEK